MPMGKKSLQDLIEKLSNAYGASGFEDEVRNIIRREIKDHVDRVIIDNKGNLICHHKGKGKEPISMVLAAHMDEIGMMVRNIDAKGRIFFTGVGGIFPESLLSQGVLIFGEEMIHGIVTCKEVEEDMVLENFPEIEDMWVDTGMSKGEIRKKGIRVGTWMVPERKFRVFGDKGVVMGKALDDRIGCAILIELAKKLKKADAEIWYLFTVQEEVGLFGVRAAIYDINPIWALAVDTTNTSYMKDKRRCGRGVVLTVRDSEFIADRCLVNALIKKADKHKIPYQLEVSDEGTTDASVISLSKGGVPTAVISVPVKNLHTTISIAHLDDVVAAVDLLEKMIQKPPLECL
jgi:putative aminopeptidase FrvX